MFFIDTSLSHSAEKREGSRAKTEGVRRQKEEGRRKKEEKPVRQAQGERGKIPKALILSNGGTHRWKEDISGQRSRRSR
ncbi:MAG TPA: hypothetical protein VLH60_01655, partial [Sedimentisphaerales bacterium]|nr:hypothetical protein [Sedimentisphaerales bacterium]